MPVRKRRSAQCRCDNYGKDRACTDAADLWRQSSFIWFGGLVVDSSWMVPADTREKRAVTIRKLTHQQEGRLCVSRFAKSMSIGRVRLRAGE
jgi:hypothetical protein